MNATKKQWLKAATFNETDLKHIISELGDPNIKLETTTFLLRGLNGVLLPVETDEARLQAEQILTSEGFNAHLIKNYFAVIGADAENDEKQRAIRLGTVVGKTLDEDGKEQLRTSLDKTPEIKDEVPMGRIGINGEFRSIFGRDSRLDLASRFFGPRLDEHESNLSSQGKMANSEYCLQSKLADVLDALIIERAEQKISEESKKLKTSVIAGKSGKNIGL